ncbi:hypothetical protein [Thermotoga sp. KOL6]|nr:hypothetical protein [Thermotoga sp. KOL6]
MKRTPDVLFTLSKEMGEFTNIWDDVHRFLLSNGVDVKLLNLKIKA